MNHWICTICPTSQHQSRVRLLINLAYKKLRQMWPTMNTVDKRKTFEHGTVIESQKSRNQVNKSMEFRQFRL